MPDWATLVESTVFSLGSAGACWQKAGTAASNEAAKGPRVEFSLVEYTWREGKAILGGFREPGGAGWQPAAD